MSNTPTGQWRSEKGRLAPFLSPLGVWAYGMGTAIGWGSLVVTSNGYLLEAGPLGSVIGIVLGTVVMVVIARNYAYMMNRYPDSGGSYTYVRHVLGPDYGFLLAWFLVLTYISVLWANATSLPLFSRYFLGGFFKVGYLYTLFGYEVYAGEVALTMIAIALVGLLCTRDKRIKETLMIGLALIFVICISVCFFAALFMNVGGGTGFDPAFIPDKGVLMQVAAVGIMTPWAFIGFESISNSTEEFDFPRSKSFRILLTVVIMTGLLYVFVTLLSATAYPDRYDSWYAYLSDLGNLEGIEGLPPFYAAYHYLGDVGIGVLMAALLALVISSLIGNTVALSRLFVTLARDNVIPSSFSRLNDKGTPQNAVIAVAGVSLLIPLLGRTPIGWIVDITTIGACVVYCLVSLSEYRIGKTEDDKMKVFLGLFGAIVMILIALAAFLPSLVAADNLAAETYLLIAVWAILGFIYFRIILRNDTEWHYGKSIVVWVFLLVLVLFTSTVWMQKMEDAIATDAMYGIQAHLTETFAYDDVTAQNEFIQAQLEDMRRANTRTSLATILMFGMAVVMMFSNYRFMRMRQEESAYLLGQARDAAYRDPLTGVKSKNAYIEWERALNVQVAEGSTDEIVIIVCDVNGLKYINDTQGHAAGDEYIRASSGLVCNYFKRSPVFRVGGDEFVVIPQGDDLESFEVILDEFNAEVERNIGTVNPVISAGWSVFRPSHDSRFHDVFERADARMYQRKMQLKAMGAATRD